VGVLWTFSTVVEPLRLPVTKIAIPITRTTTPTTSRIQPAVLMLNPCVCTVIANAMIAPTTPRMTPNTMSPVPVPLFMAPRVFPGRGAFNRAPEVSREPGIAVFVDVRSIGTSIRIWRTVWRRPNRDGSNAAPKSY